MVMVVVVKAQVAAAVKAPVKAGETATRTAEERAMGARGKENRVAV